MIRRRFRCRRPIAILAEGRSSSSAARVVYRRPNSVTVAAFLGFHNLLAASRDDTGRVHSPLGSWQGIHLPDNAEAEGILLIRPDGARLLSGAADAPNGIIIEGLVERRQFQGAATIDGFAERTALVFDRRSTVHHRRQPHQAQLDPTPWSAEDPQRMT
jgi:ABC-type Fe3+/spermidine/putrescine transport system ATPase subunit